jgi:VIT1/CCC1 family predicted Fe2+/Mn2+ transporter
MSDRRPHRIDRVGWLRASVLGANDGIVSTASLILGVAAAGGELDDILIAGVAGLVAGAMSMAAGEYVSVSSQADAERAELAVEQAHLDEHAALELKELEDLYIERGLEPAMAKEVAKQLTAKDALATHAREELGISHITAARPVQAALASMASFGAGSALPLLAVLAVPAGALIPSVAVTSLLFLALLGAVGARAGGAPIGRAMLRVAFWGILAMALTAGIGALVGKVV